MPEVQLLRERIDLALLAGCAPVMDAAAAAAAREDAPPAPAEVLAAAQQSLRLNKRHVKKVWEALLYKHTSMQSGKGRTRLLAMVRWWLSLCPALTISAVCGTVHNAW